MRKFIVSAVLFILPAMFCFAANTDQPQKSVSSQIRVIIPPFAIIHLGNNVTKAVPLNAVSDQMKQSGNDRSSFEVQTSIESNKAILTSSESKTEKTASEVQITTTYTSTQL